VYLSQSKQGERYDNTHGKSRSVSRSEGTNKEPNEWLKKKERRKRPWGKKLVLLIDLAPGDKEGGSGGRKDRMKGKC